MKRVLSYFMVLILLCGLFVPNLTLQTEAASAKMTIEQLQEKFPAGKYWNHAGNPGSSNAVNNQNGYTSTPCSKHGTVGTSAQTCNGFQPGSTQLSWQCMGFAEKLGYDFTGYNPRNNANGWYTYTSSSSLDSLKPGDIVRYKNNGHSIFVTNVSGNTVTYADCNSDGHCIIRWGKTITKSTLKATFTYVRSAPFKIETGNVLSIKYDANGGTIKSSDKYYLSDNDVVCLKSSESIFYHKMVEGQEYEDGLYNYTTFGITRTGYTFVGWGTEYDGGTIYSQSGTMTAKKLCPSISSGNQTLKLYAIWEPNVLSVYFNANGGTISSDEYKLSNNVVCWKSDGSKYVQKWTYNKTKTDGLVNNSTFGITKTGYKFAGWGTTSSGGTIFDQGDNTLVATDINSNVKNGNCSTTLYAIWTANKYMVTYNANGGSGVPGSQTKTHGTTLTLSSTVPTRTGYTFLGWSTSSTATSATYSTGGSFTSNANTALYAVWSLIEDNSPEIYGQAAVTKPGGTVSVPLYIENNPGIAYSKFKITYADGLELISAEDNGILLGTFTTSQTTMGDYYIIQWMGASDSTEDGRFVTFTFKVSEDAKAGNYAINVSCVEAYNSEFEDVELLITSPVITVSDYLPGDVNDDGRVNGKDGILLAQYLAEWNVTINMTAADVNDDGKVNGKDGILLAQYLAEWDVTLG